MPASTGILCPIHRDNLDRRHQSRRFATETSLVVDVIRTLRALLIVTFRPESRAEFCYVAHRRLYSDMLRLPSCAKVGKRERPPTKAAY
jgi:hypothetical protein